MKIASTTLLTFLLLAVNIVSAEDSRVQILNAKQVAKLDLSGKWSGTRSQYSWDKKSFVEVFQYEFDLKQEGDIITGTTTIISSNGEYADMKIEGVIIGNKLHFAETEVKGAIRPEGKVWCFKSGELNFARMGDDIKLLGETQSYMEVYNYPCSGGVTNLKKVDNSANLAALINTPDASNGTADKVNISVFPSPFIQYANINYSLTEDSKVKIEVFDISGKMMTNLFEGNQKAGSYNVSLDGKTYTSNSGIYIIKMTVNGEFYSRQIVQMR